MVRLYDFVLVLSFSCDYFACPFPPFSVDFLEVVGSSPLFDYPFVLLQGFFWYV